MENLREKLLHRILTQPTSPFREARVIATILDILKSESVPHFVDPVGNIIIGVSSEIEYLDLVQMPSTEPVRVFIAHMDHPGFHGVQWKSPTELAIQWHGGSPTQHLEGAKVWLSDRTGWSTEGKMSQACLHPSGRAIDSALIILEDSEVSQKLTDPTQIYGGFGFRSPWWQEGELIYTKAADDLVGSFAVVSLAIDLWKVKSNPPPFIGLLTRAEEVGFIGAIGHFELNWLQRAKRPVLCVSLEASRTLPGAEMGKGPVVRLGDKFTVFDSGALKIFSELAQTRLPDQHQKRIMDGGTCEASAATVYGFPSIGISVPLGNYHNQSFEGGPDSAPRLGPAPEFVHRQDIVGLIQLCHSLMTPSLNWKNPWQKKLEEFRREFNGYKPLLDSGLYDASYH